MALETQVKSRRLFLIGAAKCGTTTVDALLRSHPEVYMSPIKEPNYFSMDIDPNQFKEEYRSRSLGDLNAYFKKEVLPEVHLDFVRDPKQYQKLFANAGNAAWLGESSTSYLISEEAPKLIAEKYPDASIIICLRDPVDRLLSHLKMALQEGYISVASDAVIEADQQKEPKGWGKSQMFLELGEYGRQLKSWLKHWDREQIHVIYFEDIQYAQQKVCADLSAFLNVSIFAPDETVHANRSGVPKYPKLNALLKGSRSMHRVKGALPDSFKKRIKEYWQDHSAKINIDEQRWREYYQPDIELLEKILDRSFEHWK